MKPFLVLMIALSAAPAFAGTEAERLLGRLRRFATNPYEEYDRMKGLCVCRGAGDLNGRAGILRWHDPAVYPGVQYHVNCETHTFDDVTGEIVSGGYCTDFVPLGD